MNDVGGPLIDAGKNILMIPADMVFIAKLLAYSVAAIAVGVLLRAVSHVVQTMRGK